MAADKWLKRLDFSVFGRYSLLIDDCLCSSLHWQLFGNSQRKDTARTMPRKPRYTLDLTSATARLALPLRKKFYPCRVALGIQIAYRRNAGPGTWTVLAHGWTKRLGVADDYEAANGASVLSFDQAVETAKKLARGEDTGAAEVGKPATVAEAVASYKGELQATGKRIGNATRIAFHLKGMLALNAKPVGLLGLRDFKAFRDHLVSQKMKPATVARTLKVFMTAVRNAAAEDQRIDTRKWQLDKLGKLVDATVARSALWVLGDDKVAAAVAAAYAISYRFGLYVETLAVFAVRPIQARRLTVADLEAQRDTLQMPSSMKGKGRLRIDHEPLPISGEHAQRLAAEAAGRDGNEPLLRDDDGNAWAVDDHPTLWERAAAAAKLPLKPERAEATRTHHVGIYSLRHSGIARMLLRGLPVALVAKATDTSETEIRRHYGKYIVHTDTAAALLRAAQPSFAAPAPAPTVVPLKRRAVAAAQ
jgi:hypothetical protein